MPTQAIKRLVASKQLAAKKDGWDIYTSWSQSDTEAPKDDGGKGRHAVIGVLFLYWTKNDKFCACIPAAGDSVEKVVADPSKSHEMDKLHAFIKKVLNANTTPSFGLMTWLVTGVQIAALASLAKRS